jgi:catechol 2,3-dioxygenase-like lactoylglutathione lyase family enzyme
MMTTDAPSRTGRLTGIAPQFLVDDLDAAIAYYRDQLGFVVDFSYDSFYAGVSRDGFAIHLKCAPKTQSDRAHRKRHEHLDAYIGVTGVAALHDELRSRGARITRPPEARPWWCVDFYVEDPDGYILCFSEPTSPSPPPAESPPAAPEPGRSAPTR